jgi:hypothetical protein
MPSRYAWQEWLHERPIAVVATVSEDGTPHAAPVEVVVRDDKVYVWCESYSVKARNAVRTGVAALTAYKGQAGVLVRGSARPIRPSDAEYEGITRAFLDKYSRDEEFGNDLVLEITPRRVGAWD